MPSRSLKVSKEYIKYVKNALLRSNYVSQKDLSEDLGLARSTIGNFLNGKPVSIENFKEICFRLDLDFQQVAESLQNKKEPKSILYKNQADITQTNFPKTSDESWIYTLVGKRGDVVTQIIGCFRVEYLTEINAVKASGKAFWVHENETLDFRGSWETEEALNQKDRFFFYYWIHSRASGDPYHKPDYHLGIIRLEKAKSFEKPLKGDLYYQGFAHDLFDWRDSSPDMFAERVPLSWEETLELITQEGISIFNLFQGRSELMRIDLKQK